MTKPNAKRHAALKVAVSALALSFGAGLAVDASAQQTNPAPAPATPDGVWHEPSVVVNNNMTANGNPPTGAWDNTTNITGIGQMTIRAAPTSTGMNLCSGTLINPRTVIFAAHCVNDRPANVYGANGAAFGPWTTGTPMAFGFKFDNLPAVRQWLGLDASPVGIHQTNTAGALYAVEHVWYDDRSNAPTSIGFLEADIAIATLDTPAWDIPTWVMLFTPLQTQTHAVITGYGGNGTSASVNAGPLPSGNTPIDWRRRAAENVISFMGSLDDTDDWLFGPSPVPINPQTLYLLDFDSPAGEGTYTGLNPNYDFDIFNGTALPREGITAGGDSGGPLIADQYFAGTPVVVGTLSGGSRFHTNQRFATYGTTSFYQPLFMFWQEIVANNPYVYAGNRPGIRDWMNPANWVQLMDPAYGIEVDGQLVNGLPGVGSFGVSGNTPKFGEVCFLADCLDISTDPEAITYNLGTPNSIYIPGGPGSTNFVPNNVRANPALGIRPRYYDVTLSAIGETWLKNTVTIDRFTLDGGLTSLDVRSAGVLNVLGDFTVGSGFLNVDGRINSGEALMLQGLLTGRGTFNPTFFTSIDGVIAPGNLTSVGTLSIQGDVVLASHSELMIELGRNTNDRLRVLSDAAQGTTGIISVGGGLWLTPSLSGGGPRHNDTFTIVQADGGVLNQFNDVNGFLGILRPQVTYGANTVNVKLKAGSFLDAILHNPLLMPIAFALDELRESHYSDLFGLYGEIDLMDPSRLTSSFSSMTPGSLRDTFGLIEMQQSSFGMTLQDRMSVISRTGGTPGALSISGDPGQVLSFGGDPGLGAAGELSFATMLSESRDIAVLPGRLSAFFSGGYGEGRASAAAGRTAYSDDESLRTWNMVGGVEHTMDRLTLGIAAGYARGAAAQQTTAALAENDVAQTALYGVYRFDNGIYLSGLAGAGTSRSETQRRFIAGSLDYRMRGDAEGDLFLASMEAGMNLDVLSWLTLTPNASVRQYSLHMEGFEESGGETALAVDAREYARTEARLGLRMAGDHTFDSGWRLAPTLDLAAVASLESEGGGVWARFAAAPDVPFYLPGEARDDFWGEIAGGLRLSRGDTSFALQMQTSVAREELYEDRVMARYAQRF